jgi:hypothetical protein
VRRNLATDCAPRSTRPIIFTNGEACGGWFDKRDLGAVLNHKANLPYCSEYKPQ